MTAPAPRPGPDVTERLAEALTEIGDRTLPPRILAARLLPVVEAIAAERAADELEAASYSPRIPITARTPLREWAAALRGEGRG